MIRRKNMFMALIVGASAMLLFAYILVKSVQHTEESTIVEREESLVDANIQKKEVSEEEYKINPDILKKTFVSGKDTADRVKEIKELIKKLESESFSIAKDSADKLVEYGEEAVPFLLKELQEASVRLKGQIVFILGRIGDKTATPILIKILDDDNAYIRRNTAEALGKIQDERALEPLAPVLFDKDVAVRERAAWALGELGNTLAVGGLVGRLSDEKEGRVKSAVVNALGKLRSTGATQTLLTELESKSDRLYRNEVATALGDIGDMYALPGLLNYLNELKQYKPTEPMVIFQWEEAIRITEEAINKIRGS